MNQFGVIFITVIASIACIKCQITGDNVRYRPGQCLPGDKHKELASPEPEGPDYKQCLQWESSSCCTAEFTQVLAEANVTNIDGFHWNRCGDLSQRCQDFFIQIECFYRCSPNVAHWALLEFDSALANLPICHDFCDNWFEACAEDQTCARNWITDWVCVDGKNICKTGFSCSTYRDVYKNGSGICSQLWGQSFIYSEFSSEDPSRQCLVPHWAVDFQNPNIAALNNMNISLLTGRATNNCKMALEFLFITSVIVALLAVL